MMEATSAKGLSNKTWQLALALVVITFVVYGSIWRTGYVWDDRLLIIDNPLIKAGDGLYRFWCTTEAKDYWPLTSSLWWLEWRLFGDSATGYHVINLLLHAIDSVLIWLILRQLKIPWAWLAALIFAIHPVNVATVAWFSEQKNTLSMLFYLTALLVYLRFDEEGRWRWFGLSLGAFVLALLSKTAAVMLPFVLLGCVWWRHGRLRGKDLLRSIPFFVVSLILGLVTIWFQYNRAIEGTAATPESFAARLSVAGWAPWFYLGKALWPINLTVFYPKWETSGWLAYLPGVLLVGSFVLFWWRRKGWGRPLLFGLGYFVVTLFPVLGFFRQSFHQFSLVADHFQYFSIIGVIALVVAGAENTWRQFGEEQRSVGAIIGLVVLLALAAATWKRSWLYAGPKTLWQDNVTKEPGVSEAHGFLGGAYMLEGDWQGAAKEFERSLQIQPHSAVEHYNLAGAYRRMGRVSEALAQYEQALQIKPDYVEALNNLGVSLGQAGDLHGAITRLEQTLRIKPNFAEAHNNLGVALEFSGRTNEALEQYEQALQIKPDFVEARQRLERLRSSLSQSQPTNLKPEAR